MNNDNSVMIAVGKRIAKIRRERGDTQEQLAEAIGISTNYLSEIERGKCSVRLDKLVLIIRALNCSADDLFADVLDNGYRIKSSRIGEKIERLSPADREKAFAVLDALIGSTEK